MEEETPKYQIYLSTSPEVQKGNVYLLTHPDDYESGMYSGLTAKEGPTP